MTSEDDPDGIYFEATFEFIKVPYVCMEGRRKSGPSGTNSISLEDVSIYKRDVKFDSADKRLCFRIYTDRMSNPSVAY